MNVLVVLGLVATGFAVVPREVLVAGVLWLVGLFSPSTALNLFLGALMMWW